MFPAEAPTLPVSVSPDGSVMAIAGKYARNAVLSVFEMMGGARGMYDWAKKSPANEADFYTKIFPKTIQKEFEINDKRDVEDVLAAIDAEFTVVERVAPPATPVPLVENVVDAGDENVDDWR